MSTCHPVLPSTSHPHYCRRLHLPSGAVISAPSFHACDPYLYLKYAAGLDCTLQFSFLPLYYNAMDNGILWSIASDLPDLGDGAP